MIGECSAGYEWVKQDDGYRCSAGACFVSFEELTKGGTLGSEEPSWQTNC
jgi:hypothetical protein